MNNSYKCNICELNQSKVIDYFPNFITRNIKLFIYFFKINFFIKIFFKNVYLKKFPDGEELFLNKKIIICSNCKLGSTFPMIDEKTLINYYHKNYWINPRNLNSNEITDNEKIYLKEKIKFLKKNLDGEIDYTFAEFGCGRGTFAQIAIDSLDIKKYFGIELSKVSLNDYLKQNDKFIHLEQLDQIDDNSVDIFVMIQSIEHITDVNLFFKRLHNKLKKNSLIFIETPNYNDNYFYKKAGWVPHTLFFNKKSLLHLAKKFKFEVIDFQFIDGTWAKNGFNLDVVENEDHNTRILLKKIKF